MNLTTRKNVRDTEAKRDEHLKNIKEFFGMTDDITLEAPFAEINEILSSSYKDRVGTVVQDWILGGFYKCLSYHFKDNALFKKALPEAWTTRKLALSLTGSETNYHQVRLIDGVLVIQCKPDTVCTNVDDIGKDILKTIDLSGGGLPLPSKANLEENQATIDAAVATISAATGVTATLTADWISLDKAWASGYPNRVGDVTVWFLNDLAKNIESACKDDMVKEAVAEVFKGEIVFSHAPDLAKRHDASFADGKMLVQIKEICNTNELGADLESKL